MAGRAAATYQAACPASQPLPCCPPSHPRQPIGPHLVQLLPPVQHALYRLVQDDLQGARGRGRSNARCVSAGATLGTLRVPGACRSFALKQNTRHSSQAGGPCVGFTQTNTKPPPWFHPGPAGSWPACLPPRGSEVRIKTGQMNKQPQHSSSSGPRWRCSSGPTWPQGATFGSPGPRRRLLCWAPMPAAHLVLLQRVRQQLRPLVRRVGCCAAPRLAAQHHEVFQQLVHLHRERGVNERMQHGGPNNRRRCRMQACNLQPAGASTGRLARHAARLNRQGWKPQDPKTSAEKGYKQIRVENLGARRQMRVEYLRTQRRLTTQNPARAG